MTAGRMARTLATAAAVLAAVPVAMSLAGMDRASAQSAACEAAGDAAATRAAFYSALNDWRGREGLPAMAPDTALERASDSYACVMVEREHFDHVGPDGSTPMTRAADTGYTACLIAENIAAGQGDAAEVFQAWLDSPGHRRNMALDDASDVGLGLTIRRGGPQDGLQGRPYWALLLGRRC
ncbi:MAG: CAP domain-containing protein [Pseudomonadota bacterium]